MKINISNVLNFVIAGTFILTWLITALAVLSYYDSIDSQRMIIWQIDA